MSSFLDHVVLGYHIAFSATNLFSCFLGVLIGTLIGVLPGIGPVGTIAILLPITYGMDPASAIIMLAGIYYGAQYGGSITSILVNIPGEVTSIVATLDGYQMARKGRAGPALGIAACGSFIAGTIGTIILMFVVLPLSRFGLGFGPAEYFGLIVLTLSIVSYLAQSSMMKAVVMATIGISLSQVGIDMVTGTVRFTFDVVELQDGLGITSVLMGLFGVGEVLINLEESHKVEILKEKIKGIWPTFADWKASIGPILRGSFLGFFLGILPGGGAILSTFLSYAVEKKISKHPQDFGKGAIEGVAGPESANNAASSGAFIPLFALGLPSNAITVLLMGALMVHGIAPGPFFIKDHSDLFWGTIMSMYIGNVMLVVLNLPLIGLWVQILKVPYRILFPFLLLLCIIGSYSINNSDFDVLIMLIFGVIGYIFKKMKYEIAPLVMGFVLGPLLETNLRQALLISGGDLSTFYKKPIAATCLAITILLLVSPVILRMGRRVRAKIAE